MIPIKQFSSNPGLSVKHLGVELLLVDVRHLPALPQIHDPGACGGAANAIGGGGVDIGVRSVAVAEVLLQLAGPENPKNVEIAMGKSALLLTIRQVLLLYLKQIKQLSGLGNLAGEVAHGLGGDGEIKRRLGLAAEQLRLHHADADIAADLAMGGGQRHAQQGSRDDDLGTAKNRNRK